MLKGSVNIMKNSTLYYSETQIKCQIKLFNRKKTDKRITLTVSRYIYYLGNFCIIS